MKNSIWKEINEKCIHFSQQGICNVLFRTAITYTAHVMVKHIRNIKGLENDTK